MQKEDEKKKNIPRNDSYREWILKFFWKAKHNGSGQGSTKGVRRQKWCEKHLKL